MKIALIGATGNAGSRLLSELLRRCHSVTALSRNAERVPSHIGVTAKRADVNNKAELIAALAGHDAVISAVPFTGSNPRILIETVKAARVLRYLVVGGAGSLEVASGQRFVDSPGFPAQYREEALAGAAFLDALRAKPDSTGRSCRHPPFSSPATAPACFGSAATNASSTIGVTAPSPLKILRLR